MVEIPRARRNRDVAKRREIDAIEFARKQGDMIEFAQPFIFGRGQHDHSRHTVVLDRQDLGQRLVMII
ncbi:MAG: hypothetical protein K2X76_05055, partial [Sphingomonas sp.]|nr:hypothetical protein [Sphingomonas sp.]